MHDNPKGASDDRTRLTPLDEDVRDQSAVLREVLLLNPELTTLDELVRELTAARAICWTTTASSARCAT